MYTTTKRTIIKKNDKKDEAVSKNAPIKAITNKKYRSHIYEYVIKLHEQEGLKQIQICDRLNSEGWRNSAGGLIVQSLLSRFMKNMGYTGFSENRIKRNAMQLRPSTPSAAFVGQSATEQAIMSVLQTEMAENEKFQIIKALLDQSQTSKNKKR